MMPLSSGGRFEGVAKIIRFNTRYYIGSALGVTSVVLLLIFLRPPIWFEAPAVFAAGLMLFWTLSSLFVSWYVYDYAGVTRWEWMRPDLQHAPARWVNIHAGLDESTAALRRLLPDTDGVVIDIYDPITMTEPSIARARRMYPATEPFKVGSAKALPLPDGDRDAIFLLFAAHELRDPQDLTNLLLEARRILKSDGQILLVEHLRDLPNFVAFGPGFLHFHSGRSWRHNIGQAGLELVEQRTVTPFVQCFTLRRSDA
jgi:SAM-dependent methyltransferase